MQRKGNLLVIDDEVMLLESVAVILEDIADNIYTADSGIKGLEILKTQEIDCVICDINMPKMTGVDVIREVRASGFEKPFLFYTGHGSRELMKEVIKYGAFDFLDKPNLEGLEESVKRGLVEGVLGGAGEVEGSGEDFMSEYQKLLSQA